MIGLESQRPVQHMQRVHSGKLFKGLQRERDKQTALAALDSKLTLDCVGLGALHSLDLTDSEF